MLLVFSGAQCFDSARRVLVYPQLVQYTGLAGSRNLTTSGILTSAGFLLQITDKSIDTGRLDFSTKISPIVGDKTQSFHHQVVSFPMLNFDSTQRKDSAA